MAQEPSKFLTYMGKPLVRAKDTIYYGDPTDSCIVEMKILDNKTVGGKEIPNRISVMLVSTDILSGRPQVFNKTERTGLYNAMDVASIWLQRKLKENEKA
ncbi:MAG TPA: hypothetical protein PK854_09305 [Oscillospiraceae bacterium]|nr:hypothetical protein [Oscillospiraceae bacterium]HPS35450.1 hypothetical protein [Oscillospiraceae bacterium]